jgi:hypothetical protein
MSFRSIAKVLQGILCDSARLRDYITAIAVLITGCWALYHFRVVEERLKADLEIQHLRMQVGRRGLQLKLEAHQQPSVGNRQHLIQIVVTIENKGEIPLLLRFADNSSLSVSLVNFDDADGLIGLGTPEHPRIVVGPHADDTLVRDVIHPTETARYTAIAAVPNSGVYLATFDAAVQAAEQSETRGGESNNWLVSDYVWVQ